ncbi:MAG: hypothetical protein GEU83_11970 [Pseudonocardiaceae bacterium]|nr:hypothetical protein [Pseudonocardiaceae bacterium]
MTAHRCHRDDRCARWETDPATGHRAGASIEAEHGLCATCTRHLHQALDALPRDYLDLQMCLSASITGDAETVRGTPEPPLPLRVDVLAVQADITHEVLCWAEPVADTLGITLDTQAARDSRPGVVVQRCTRLLRSSVPVLLSLRAVEQLGWVHGCAVVTCRDGLDGALALIELHHRARAVTGLTRYIHRMTAPCPRCEAAALRRPDGSDTITCDHCGRVYTWDEYRDLCEVYVRWHERLAAA